MAKTKPRVVKKKAAAPKKQAKAAPKKKAKAAPTKKAPPRKKAKAAPAKKATPRKKAAPTKKATPRKKAAPKAKLLKILLHNQGEDPETPFAEDLGPAPGRRAGRRVRLVNVPFLHAKPTYGDVVIVEPDPEGFLTWDRAGVDFEEIDSRIEEDGGRYAMIVDYLPRTRKAVDINTVFRLLRVGAEDAGIVPEGCFGPDKDRPGRLYLAVPEELQPAEVMQHLAATEARCALTLVHPEGA